jgi:hypothetical protein
MKKLIFIALAFVLLANIAAVNADMIASSNNQNNYFNQETYGQNTIQLSETWKIKDKMNDDRDKREITITHTMNVPQYTFFSQNAGSSDSNIYQFPGNNYYQPTYSNNYYPSYSAPRFGSSNYYNNYGNNNNNNQMAQNLMNYAGNSNSYYGNNYYPSYSYPRFGNYNYY